MKVYLCEDATEYFSDGLSGGVFLEIEEKHLKVILEISKNNEKDLIIINKEEQNKRWHYGKKLKSWHWLF